MKDWAIIFIRLLIPKRDANPDETYKWQLGVFIGLVAICSLTVVHMAWSVGYPPMLFSGRGFVQMVDFNAKMEDFDGKILDVKNLIKESSKVSLDNQKKIDISRKNQIRGDVIELRRKECAASGDYQVILQTQLSELQDEWHTLSKSELKVPSCGDVK